MFVDSSNSDFGSMWCAGGTDADGSIEQPDCL